MKIKAMIYTVAALFLAVTVCGCASAPKKMQEEVAGIKTRVETLETRVEGVETKQAEVEKTTGEQAQALEELKGAKTNISVKSRTGKGSERIKDIQTCLKSAGFYNGEIDGVKGKQTRKAIKEFQKANGLEADGVVGKKTWELLTKYSQGSGK
jgi:peptidoglycan hydrolase-like protein with peptidoglycan-binding domain